MNAGELFDRTRQGLFSYLVRATGDYELSRDLLQESFVRFLAHYDGKGGTIPLLYAIAHNALVDHWRRARRISSLEHDVEDSSPDSSVRLLARERYRRVLDALAHLPQDEREILSLVATGDLSYSEIGRILGISEVSVKVKVHRARCRLKDILGKEGHE